MRNLSMVKRALEVGLAVLWRCKISSENSYTFKQQKLLCFEVDLLDVWLISS